MVVRESVVVVREEEMNESITALPPFNTFAIFFVWLVIAMKRE